MKFRNSITFAGSLGFRFLAFTLTLSLYSAVAQVSLAQEAKPNRSGIEFFESKIRPVLVGHCYRCHSKEANKMKGGLRLDTRDALLAGGDSGPAIVPGRPDQSPLYKVLTYEDDYQMPPSGKLDDSIIGHFRKWIEMGAPDPRKAKTKKRFSPVKSKIDIEAGRRYWAYQPPQQVAVSKAVPKSNQWARSTLDAFVHQKLRADGLRPNPDAPPKKLVRRLYFSLTGLPPSAKEIEAWSKRIGTTNGLDQEQVTMLADELLKRAQFGEHWGRHWMDVARFAESTGGDNNNIHPYAWRYRDYIIDSFNKDKPYDRFIKEQLAGDLLPIRDNKEWAENLIATGFLAVGVKLVGEEEPRKFRAELVDDQINTTTRAFLATTVSCARCHDHKFDPIPQADYYALAGIFRSTNTHYGLLKAQARQHAKLIDITDLGVPSARKDLSGKEFASLKKARDDAHAKMDELMQSIRGGNAPTRNILRLSRTRRDKAEAALQSFDKSGKPRVFVMGTQDFDFPAENFLLVRGEVDQRAQPVDRGFVSVLSPPRRNSLNKRAKGSGRLELAEWIASEDNPLTARVMANRTWHWLFGTGLVRTVDDFGVTGEEPVNQELLDYLAQRLIENKWSIKSLIREIVLSRTWQLSSQHDAANFAIDPDNRLSWRFSPQRLSGEAIRDAMLSVSGKLDRKRPVGSFISRVGEGSVGLSVFEPEIRKIEEPVRSVYLPRVRSVLPEMLELFDAPDASLVMGAREETNTPLQALYMLNNPFAIEHAQGFAQRVLELSDSERLKFAYMTAFGRMPTEKDKELVIDFVKTNRRLSPEDALTAWCQVLMCSSEFTTID